MEEFSLDIENHTLQCFAYNTIIVGSGAAGLCAAERLFSFGQEDVAMVTENLLGGTSRNAGSDKQTYYKLSLGGDSPDSVTELAQTLFKGGCVDGDLALVEAALSVRAFFHLVELGVPFPHDRYGQYIGYKTDYDPKQRATSAGPYTSKLMTERLEAAIVRKGIKVFDRFQAIKVLTEEKKKVIGLLCLDLDHIDDPDMRYVVFLHKSHMGYGRTSMYLFGFCLSHKPDGFYWYCLRSRSYGQESHRVAIWACFNKATLECFWFLYAGTSALFFYRCIWGQ